MMKKPQFLEREREMTADYTDTAEENQLPIPFIILFFSEFIKLPHFFEESNWYAFMGN